MIPKFILGWTFICLGCFAFRAMRFGKPKDWLLTGIRFTIANEICRFCFRMMLLLSGCVWVEKKQVKADYSEYLGEEYVYKYDGHGVVVPNHICPLDLITELVLNAPINCLIGKREAQSIPFLKWLIDDQWMIMVGRDSKDSREQRHKVLEMIEARSLEAEKGLKTPCLIFPEGATTNGNYIISFKRGGFYALRPVQPVVCKIWNLGPFKPTHGDASSLLDWILMLPQALIWTYKR